ncbi:MAG: ABC transporter ATP-binding protein [OCS116 cluster bacterium]|nr:ABC transporter ATP-binding protein [OCS116 cluster bacterium]
MLSLKNISIEHPKTPLFNISYNFEAGKFYCILGRTGAGKTEILRALMGLEQLSNGEITLDDENISNRVIWKRNMALVYQQFINYPHLNVLDNVIFPLLRQKIKKSVARQKAISMLELVGLSELADRKPSQLSGGQQQRVALARALVKDARILMMDEPLVNLDYKLREQLREEFPKLIHQSPDSVILYTTTEPKEAMQLADELLIIDNGQIAGHGKPHDLFENPPNLAVAKVISDPPISFVKGHIENGKLIGSDGTILQQSGLQHIANGEVQVGLRPDALSLGGELTSRVVLTEINGSETIVHLNFSFGQAVMLLDGIHMFEADQKINVSLDTNTIMLFSLDGQNITKESN